MPDVEGYAELVALNATERTEVGIAQDRANARAIELHEQRDRYDTERVQALTDGEIVASPELRRWLVRDAQGMPAHYRKQELTKVGHPYEFLAPEYDSREEIVEAEGRMWTHLAPRVGIPRDYTIGELRAFKAKLLAWWELWGDGRVDTRIDIMEHTCSGNAPDILWRPGTDEAQVARRHGEPEYEGTLLDALTYVGNRYNYPAPDSGHDYCPSCGRECYC